MATTGIINATNIVILADYARIASLVNAELSLSRDMIDGTTKDSAGWNQVQAGKLSWEMSGEGKLHFDETKNMAYVFDMLKNKTKFKVLFGVEETGDTMYIGDAYFTNTSGSAGVEDASTYSFAIQGTGSLRRLDIIESRTFATSGEFEFQLSQPGVYSAIKVEWNNHAPDSEIEFLEKQNVGDSYSVANTQAITTEKGVSINAISLSEIYQKISVSTSGGIKIIIYDEIY